MARTPQPETAMLTRAVAQSVRRFGGFIQSSVAMAAAMATLTAAAFSRMALAAPAKTAPKNHRCLAKHRNAANVKTSAHGSVCTVTRVNPVGNTLNAISEA